MTSHADLPRFHQLATSVTQADQPRLIMNGRGNMLETSASEQAEGPPPQRVSHAKLTCNGFTFFLPIPEPGDDLETTLRKTHGLAVAVANGGSLTHPNAPTPPSPPKPTSQAAPLPKLQDAAFALAKERMTGRELTHYKKWKANELNLPRFDFTRFKENVSPEAMRTFTQRAAAMDVVWTRQGTSPANAAYLSGRMPHCVSVVKAVEKVLKAQIELEQQQQKTQQQQRARGRGPKPKESLRESEKAELEMLQHIRTAIDVNVTREMTRVQDHVKSIEESVTILKRRLKDLGV